MLTYAGVCRCSFEAARRLMGDMLTYADVADVCRGLFDAARRLMGDMDEAGIMPDQATYSALLDS